MSTITTINSTDNGSTSRTTINTNFSNLNTDKAEGSTVTSHTGASTNVHGLTSGAAVVGNTSTQTLTNKTLTSPVIAGATISGTFSPVSDTYGITGANISGALNSLTVRELDFVLSDNTVADVSTTKHGFVPKLTNSSTTFFRADGTYAIPPGDGTVFTLSASDNLKQSADTERSAQGNSYSKRKEIQVIYSGVLRIKFDLKSSDGTQVWGRIYLNGTAYGTEQTSSSTSYATKSEDLRIGAGDLLQIYTKCTNVSSESAYVCNFRIYYDKTATSDIVVTD